MSYCPPTICRPCAKTAPMNVCFSTFTIDGLNPSATVVLTFENKADGTILNAEGVTDGNGTLTLTAAQMPPFTAGVHYLLTAFGYDWCYIVKFEHRANADGWITGTNETLSINGTNDMDGYVASGYIIEGYFVN